MFLIIPCDIDQFWYVTKLIVSTIKPDYSTYKNDYRIYILCRMSVISYPKEIYNMTNICNVVFYNHIVDKFDNRSANFKNLEALTFISISIRQLPRALLRLPKLSSCYISLSTGGVLDGRKMCSRFSLVNLSSFMSTYS